MRSRTEMVTTTFVDSEDDYSDDNDSEECWRPSASNKNGKKQKCIAGPSAKKGRKRKSSLAACNQYSKRKHNKESDDDELTERSEDEHDDFGVISGTSKDKNLESSSESNSSEKNYFSVNANNFKGTFNLLLYVKDLIGSDLNKSNNLNLWRKDNSNLLQKYIRVKTSPERYLFTSSSVYSSFDDKRISDFYEIKVKSLDSTNRRVEVINPNELQNIHHLKHKHNMRRGDRVLKDGDSSGNGEIFTKTKKEFKDHVPKHEEAIADQKGIQEDDYCGIASPFDVQESEDTDD